MASLDGGGVKMQLQGYVLLFPRVIWLDTCSDMLRSLLIAKGLYFFKISIIFLQMYVTFGNLSRLLSGPHVVSRTQGNE